MQAIQTGLIILATLNIPKRAFAQAAIFGNGGCVNTAIGCISATPGGLFTSFFRIGIGMAGGIAFLLILYGGLKIIMATGNPEKINEGKELVTSAIAGLIMIVFSVFILKVIGVNILGIPGFS